MRVRAFAAMLLAAALLTGGCGSGGDGALKSYLKQVDLEQSRYEHERARVIAALAAVHALSPDATWTRAARELRQAGGIYRDLAARMGEIRPPRPLEIRHGGLARSLLLYEEIVEAQQVPLARHDAVLFTRTVNATQPLATRAHVLRASWRVAAARAARKAGVPFPPRLLHVGT